MYILTVKDNEFNAMEFEFNSMEALGIFVSTVFATSTKNVEITIRKEEN